MKHSELTVNMFAAACYQFVKSCGSKSLHSVPSIDQKNNIEPYQLVVKTRRRKWIFFEKAEFEPTEFQLNDVMKETEPFQTKPQTTATVTEFNRSSSLSLKGHFGADISREILDAEIKADDTINLLIKFEEISKKEVKDPDLLKELSRRQISLDHEYIRQIRKDKRKSLCVISGVHFLPKGGTIHRDVDEDVDATVKATLIKGAEAEASAVYCKGRDLGLAPGTPIAYNVLELNVDKLSGAIQLILTGGSGGFKEGVGYDEVDAVCEGTDLPDAATRFSNKIDADLEEPVTIFAPMLSMPVDIRSQLNKCLLQLMAVPRDLVVIAELLDDFEEGTRASMVVKDLCDMLISPEDSWKPVLQQAGFTIKEDTVVFTEETASLKAFAEFFDAAANLDDDVLWLLIDFPETLAKPMFEVIRQGMKGAAVTDHSVCKPLIASDTAVKLLLELQFRVEDTQVQSPVTLPYSIDEVYWVLTAMYAQQEQ